MGEMIEFFFIGYAGEKNARRKPIDISDLLTRWPDATPVLMVNRPKEEAPYPAEAALEGSVLYWEVSETDVAKSGFGQAQVYMRSADGDILGKSEVINTLIKNSLNGAEQENPPAAIETWVTKILNASEEMKSGYVKQDQGAENAGKVLGIGTDGKVLPMPNSNSGGGANIDDTTPSADKTYSSQKVQTELNQLSEKIVDETAAREEAVNSLKEANEKQDAEIAKKANQTLFDKLLTKLGLTMDDLLERLPQVRLVGDLTGITDEAYVNVTCNYVDELNAVEFTDYAEIAYQGSGSLSYVNVKDGVDVAKNYKIKLYSDEGRTVKNKRIFKDWHATNNFHLKANYADATNIMNNLMMNFITKSYQYITPLPRDGARFTLDGFPVLLYINDVFCGIRFWNLKQDDKVYNLQETDLCYQIGRNNGSNTGDNSGAFIYGNLNSGSNAGKNFADAHAEIDYYWEDRVWDKTSDHPSVLYDTIQWVSEANDEEFKANLAQYFDVEYLINYFVIMYTCGMIDSKAKNFNMLYFPEKGVWYPTFYDMDNALGTNYGVGKSAYNVELSEYGCPSSRLFDKLYANFKPEIVAKYLELRQTIFTTEQVEDSITQTLLNVSDAWLSENFTAKYDGTSYSPITTPRSYIVNWAEQRFAYMDGIMQIVETVPTTSITLSADTLTFTSSAPQTLTATVAPENSTEAVIWESNNTNVATVADGVVTPVGNGDCMITATSGSYSDTCSVSVSIEQEAASWEFGRINESGEFVDSQYSITLTDSVDVSGASALLFNRTQFGIGTYIEVRAAQYDASNLFLTLNTANMYSNKSEYAIVAVDNAAKSARIGYGQEQVLTNEYAKNVAEKMLFECCKTPDAGYINDSGVLTNKNDAFVNAHYTEAKGTVKIKIGNTFEKTVSALRYAEYSENKEFIKRAYSASNEITVELDANTRYVKIGIDVNGNIADAAAILSTITVD